MKLRDEQLKTIMYMQRLLYKSLMVTSNQKSFIDIHTKKEKGIETQHWNSLQSTRGKKKEGEAEMTYKIKSKTINKMALRIHISIITLNVNRLNSPTKRHWLAEWV